MKAVDDGYRGVHAYYAVDNHHYPVEVQFHSKQDSFLNVLLHDKVYKYHTNPAIGAALKQSYDSGMIIDENSFMEVLYNVLSGS